MQITRISNMAKMSETQERVMKYVEQIQVEAHFNVQNGSTAIYGAYRSLYEAGVLQLILQNTKDEALRKVYEKTVRCIKDASRSGIHE